MTVSVDLVSDVVCPWCWLGLRYWQRARNLEKTIATETILRPYQLDPEIPREGADYRAYIAKKFSSGASERWKAMREHLEAAAPEIGIEFRDDEIATRPNTLDAHRLIRWAQGQGLGEAVADALFKAFFWELRDLSRREVLAEIAGESGLDGDLVAELLATQRDVDAVLTEERFYRDLGVAGVPCYIFNGQFAVSGAQSPDVLADAISEAASLPPDQA